MVARVRGGIFLFIVVAMLAGPAAAPARAAAPAPSTYGAAARSAFAGLQSAFALPGTPLLAETAPGRPDGPRYAYHWPFSRAMAATIDMAALDPQYRPGVLARLAALEPYWDTRPGRRPGYASAVLPPVGPGGDRFYDDNAWTALDLLRVRQQQGDAGALRRAQELFEFIIAGWSSEAVCDGDPAPGGVFWKEQVPGEGNRDRNVVSTATAAELGLRLYLLTGDERYRALARVAYDWVNAALRDSAGDGLYRDHVGVGADGRCFVEPAKWSYNQGTMIGVNVLLAEATGDRSYLGQAEAIARAALRYYENATASGGYARQDPAFNAIFFRNLVLLRERTGDGALRRAILDALTGYADRVWADPAVRRDTPQGTLFAFHPADDGVVRVALIDQAAMVEVYALAAGAQEGPPALQLDARPGATTGAIFAPGEPIALWYNRPAGAFPLALGPVTAGADGRLDLALGAVWAALPRDITSIVAAGTLSGVQAVATFPQRPRGAVVSLALDAQRRATTAPAFFPNEPLAVWYNLPDGTAGPFPTGATGPLVAGPDGRVDLTIAPADWARLPAGATSIVIAGMESGVSAIAALPR